MTTGLGLGLGLIIATPPPHPLSVLGSSAIEMWDPTRGNTVSTDGNFVGALGNVLVQGTALLRPGSSSSNANFGNRPTLNFTSGTHALNCATVGAPVPGTTPRSYYLILRHTTWVSGGRICGGGSFSLASLIYCNTGTPRVTAYNGANGATNTGLAIGTTGRLVASFSNAAGNFLRTVGDAGTDGNADNGQSAASGWGFGDRADGSGGTAFELGLAIIKNGVITSGEIAAIDHWARSQGFPI